MANYNLVSHKTLVLALGLVLAAGCRKPTAIVTTATAPPYSAAQSGKLDGVPFYVQRGVCKQETVWAEPKYTLQVDVLAGDKVIASRSMIIPRSKFLADAQVKTLLDRLNALSSARKPEDFSDTNFCPSAVQSQWDGRSHDMKTLEQSTICDELTTPGCKSIAASEASGDLLRLVNTAKVTSEVDYSHVYYLNTMSPWNGTASVDTKLNADGTLGEGSVQRDDETWSTILNAVGSLAGDVTTYGAAKVTAAGAVEAARVAAVATTPNVASLIPDNNPRKKPSPCGAVVPGWPMPDLIDDNPAQHRAADGGKPGGSPAKESGKDKPDEEQPPAISYRVSIAPVVYLHDHTRTDANIAACAPDPTGVVNGSFTITKADGGDKPDPGAIKVSGQVVLPKSDDSKKK